MPLVARAEVPHVDAPSAAELDERYVRTRTPVVLRNAVDDWTAHAAFTDEYLQRFADHPIDAGGARRPLGELLRALAAGEPLHTSLDPFELPAWLEHFGVPPLFPRERLTRARIWMGGAARYPLHYDDADNLHAVVRGHKTFWLIAPEELARVYPVDARRSMRLGINWSEVDIYDPDLARFPAFADARVLRAELGPRDTLYLPAFWWHAVEHRGCPTIAVNFWWSNDAVETQARRLGFFGDRQLIAELRRRLGA
jgi:hypothetical protein